MGKNRSYAAGWNMELPPRQSENPESCDYRWSIPVLVTVQYGDMCWVPHKAWAYRMKWATLAGSRCVRLTVFVTRVTTTIIT